MNYAIDPKKYLIIINNMRLNLKMKHLLFILLFLFPLISCDDQNSNSIITPSFIITSEDDGKIFKASTGSTFQAIFDECAGCEDIWKINEMDSNIISLTRSFIQNPSCTNCEGGSHEKLFEFLTNTTGQSILVFNYFDETITVTIQVE
jgi:hypothetical protein